MKQRLLLAGIVFAVCAAALFWALLPRHPRSLTIGLVPSATPEIIIKSFEPTRSYLEAQLDMPVTVTVPSDYAGLVKGMKSGQIDIGWFGAFSYIAAQSELELEPMAVQYRKGFGISYHSLIVARKDSGIRSLEQLEGKTFAFVDKGSTSGFVIPYALLKSRNLDYNNYFRSVTFSGTHDAVLADIAGGRADAGALEDLTYQSAVGKGLVREQDMRIIWQSDPIPGSPFAARKALDPSVRKKFKDAMLSIHENNYEALQSFDSRIEKYVPFDDSLYNDIRNIATVLGKQYMIDNFLNK